MFEPVEHIPFHRERGQNIGGERAGAGTVMFPQVVDLFEQHASAGRFTQPGTREPVLCEHQFVLDMCAGLAVHRRLLFSVLPGDPARLTCGKACTPAIIEANRHRLGLDLPVWQQYWEQAPLYYESHSSR